MFLLTFFDTLFMIVVGKFSPNNRLIIASFLLVAGSSFGTSFLSLMLAKVSRSGSF